MSYLFTPMEIHPDKGFGTCADAFYEAAKGINSKAMLIHLPLLYLLRHSIELYLKSLLILFSVHFSENEAVRVISKYSNEHRIRTLFDDFEEIFRKHFQELQESTKVNWEMPQELSLYIDKICKIDNGSTYFRYPVNKKAEPEPEKDQSSYVTKSEIIKKVQNGKDKAAIFIVENKNGSEIFEFGNSYDDETIDAFSEVCKMLSGLHFMTRNILFGGF